jgi:predicted TIM-barrel fold metal-dependent hydrolase
MIIDSHVHIGAIMNWNFTVHTLVSAMEQSQIDFSLVSNISGGEYINETEENPGSQIGVNDAVKVIVNQYPKKMKGLFWIRPHLEGYIPAVESYLATNRKSFCGLKVHPTQSRLAFMTEYHRCYLDMCARLHLPVAVHSEADSFADPKLIYQTAKENPAVDFIMVHLGLHTDHEEAIQYVKILPNLYGDTTFVDEESVLRAVRLCGSKKILFGTDAPTFGIDTYRHYEKLLKRLNEALTTADFEDIAFRNAKNLFKLNEVKE